MAVTFHEVRSTLTLACDDCGSLVGGEERDRDAHQRWHAGRVELADEVIDLRQRVEV